MYHIILNTDQFPFYILPEAIIVTQAATSVFYLVTDSAAAAGIICVGYFRTNIPATLLSINLRQIIFS